MDQIRMKPSTFVVLEGYDATGKTTQLTRLQDAAEERFGHKLFAEAPYFTHQPSGSDALGEAIYRLTEGYEINNPWCRQFLHLASHANHYENHVIPALSSGRSVFMDRCWWSTFAYGFYAGALYDGPQGGMNAFDYLRIARLPTQGYAPHVVFLFRHAWSDDEHNTEELAKGYEWLYQAATKGQLGPTRCFDVPPLGIEETTAFMFDKLAELELTE